MTNRSIVRASANLALAAVGWGAVGLGTVGLFLPGLPTTVFVLIAFYCFSKTSPRFAQRLMEHRWLGSALRPYLAAGGLSRTAKRAAVAAMWTSILVSSAVLLRVYVLAALGTVALGAVGTLAIQFGVRTVPACATQPQRAKGTWT
jgi:uncharacterized membrane protein YbaN (DUF454 family)